MSGVGVAERHPSSTHLYSSLEEMTRLLINSLRVTPQGIFKNYPHSHFIYPDHWGANYWSKSALDWSWRTILHRNPPTASYSDSEGQPGKLILRVKRWRLLLWCQGAFEANLFHLSGKWLKAASLSPYALLSSGACKVKCVIAFLKGLFVPKDSSLS